MAKKYKQKNKQAIEEVIDEPLKVEEDCDGCDLSSTTLASERIGEDYPLPRDPMVSVRVNTGVSIYEGVLRHSGEIFSTTRKRAKELGSAVTIMDGIGINR